MNYEQEYLRKCVKRLKWERGIDYRYIAEEILDMKYNSFMNYVHGYKNLGYKRKEILKAYIRKI